MLAKVCAAAVARQIVKALHVTQATAEIACAHDRTIGGSHEVVVGRGEDAPAPRA
ncbi:MAG TPA: hypothetical protein VM100_11865 [Longimicrobiales bacterium]|nr:hypothetical protein [Longimicrobiales bacterium]